MQQQIRIFYEKKGSIVTFLSASGQFCSFGLRIRGPQRLRERRELDSNWQLHHWDAAADAVERVVAVAVDETIDVGEDAVGVAVVGQSGNEAGIVVESVRRWDVAAAAAADCCCCCCCC